MKRKSYVTPVTDIHLIEAQNMLALSTSDKPADGSSPMNNENIFTDIWGNNF